METKKRLSREQKREQAVIDLINQMFIIAGHEVTYDDVKDRKDDWYAQWTMTKYLAEREMAWVNLQWGLKYSDYGQDDDTTGI